MVKITEELVRKKSEHNELIIGTLEELSLHQEDIDKIEHLGNWCKNLEILYLQSNLISKIENLQKLKNLKYLNLAINNIEKIENLERCESLEKLDLTLNFIGDIETQLPQLQELDSNEISRSERIKAQQILDKITPGVLKDQEKYKIERLQQIERLKLVDNTIPDEKFWNTPSENAPETRREISQRQRKCRGKADDTNKQKKKKKEVAVYNKQGRPLNINEAKLDFTFIDDDPKEFILDIAVYKYLDSNLIDVDVQPIYVRVSIKDKIFQFVLSEEVYINKSTAQRSQITGHLVIKMPKVSYKPILEKENESNLKKIKKSKPQKKNESTFLDVNPENDSMDFSKIIEKSKKIQEIINNEDIPPLEYI
ncbi:dynein axonemal assembly factor 11-like isoform X2 [Onthophagus taurus]|uniref:dynein axonemal assembly factor 11-like isoform X2 n=1 Tax=Onthophagus taurus TaxID=166361 RepID=UPI0039BE4927